MLKESLLSAIPSSIKRSLEDALCAVRVYRSIPGIVPRECPICGFRGLFRAYGRPPRYDAQCPKCDSLERHRLTQLALRDHPLPADAAVIHFAPEKAIAQILPSKNYRSAEIEPGKADLVLDLCAIALPDRSADVVVVNHVFEHVDDDSVALSEVFRILRPGGLLIATVPIIDGWAETYEDRAITGSVEREVHYGQWDHVRYYGRDFRSRVTDAGFALTEFTAFGADCARYGLLHGETVFFGRKPATPP